MRKHAVRFLRLRKRYKLIFAFVLFLYIALLCELYAYWFVYPHTTLSGIPISGKSRKEINALLDRLSSLPYKVRIQNREYIYTYSNLGVNFDKNHITSLVFARNRKPFPISMLLFLRSLGIEENLDIPLVFTQNFTYFIDQTIFDFSTSPDTMYFDNTDKSLVYIENEERYRIDEQYLKELLISNIGNNTKPLYPKLVRLKNIRAQNAVDASTRMKDIYLTPLTVIVDASGNTQSFVLTEEDLLKLTNISLSDDQTNISIAVNNDFFTTRINDQLKKMKFFTKGNIVTPKVIEDMTNILRARFAGRQADALTISLDNGPNTTGSVAKRYIEVDISQQKMFLFNEGLLYKTFRVSTGLEYPTPTGEFEILNKTGLGYSSIYNVWMAWWMGFKFSDELHAYFGIHELPYTMTNGDKIHRPANFIGSPNTGGCVALAVGDAEIVYRFAEIGTKVVIYN